MECYNLLHTTTNILPTNTLPTNKLYPPAHYSPTHCTQTRCTPTHYPPTYHPPTHFHQHTIHQHTIHQHTIHQQTAHQHITHHYSTHQHTTHQNTALLTNKLSTSLCRLVQLFVLDCTATCCQPGLSIVNQSQKSFKAYALLCHFSVKLWSKAGIWVCLTQIIPIASVSYWLAFFSSLSLSPLGLLFSQKGL